MQHMNQISCKSVMVELKNESFCVLRWNDPKEK